MSDRSAFAKSRMSMSTFNKDEEQESMTECEWARFMVVAQVENLLKSHFESFPTDLRLLHAVRRLVT